MNKIRIFFISILCIWIFTGCNTTKYLDSNTYLYKSSNINFVDTTTIPAEQKNLDKELLSLSKLQPNKEFLRIYPLKLWLYDIGTKGIDNYVRDRSALGKKFLFLNFDTIVNQLNILEPNSNFRNWLISKVGEPPHLMDSAAAQTTAQRMENYLYNRGYFYPKVTYEVSYNDKKKRATITYNAGVNILYRMRNINYVIDDKNIAASIKHIDSTGPLQPGKPFDVDYLKSERTRINNYLLDNGYYKFDKQYIYFEVDSTSGKDSLDIYVKISKPAGDSIHHPYRIRNIYVYTNAARDFENKSVICDTIVYADSSKHSTYYIISSQKDYKAKVVAASIFMDQGQKFSLSKFQQTVSAFSNTGIFKYLSVQTLEIDSGKATRYLDFIIKLEPANLGQTTEELNASSTSDYLLGTYGDINFYRKNIFKSFDQFRIGLSGGIETQFTLGEAFINTSELSFITGLQFPRMFWPFPFKYAKGAYPKTSINAKFNYINRINYYTLVNTTFEYGCEWFDANKSKKHIFQPIVINFINVPFEADTFKTILENNLLLKQSFESQFIIGPIWTWIYNSQALGSKFSDIYYRQTLEVSQKYVRLDLDFRNYLNFGVHSHLVERAATGIAIPYTGVVPYVKQFFVGGANSLRAFPIRRLGPGGYINYIFTGDALTPVIVDQSADFKLELNVEYRFDITKYLEGALFCDAGNIWTLKEDIYRPNSQFQFSTFYKQIAVGPGAGIRLDLPYFILRLDGAYPLYDPALDGPTSQNIRDLYGDLIPPKKIVWNLAIGYPF